MIARAGHNKPPKRPPLTDEQKQEIFELRGERGLTYGQISRKLDVDVGAVSWHCLMNGVERAGRKPGLHKIRAPENLTCMRNGFIVRGYTEEDDKRLLEIEAKHRADGLVNYAALGRAMIPPRQPNSIRGRLATLARRESRKEEAEGKIL